MENVLKEKEKEKEKAKAIALAITDIDRYIYNIDKNSAIDIAQNIVI